MDPRKIVVGCFVGGFFVCAALAFALPSGLRWLSPVIGIIAGYLAYDFREVIVATPASLQLAWKGSLQTFWEVLEAFRAWCAEPHPFLFFGAALTAYPSIWFVATYGGKARWVMGTVVFSYAAVVGSGLVALLVFIGARSFGERCFQLQAGRGYRLGPITYWNVLRWAVKGLGLILLYCVWTWWTRGLRLAGRFCCELYRLIHCQGRLVCAVYGTVGGLLTWWLASTSAQTMSQQIALCIVGGLVGAALGRLDYELVRRCWPRFVPSTR